MVDLFLNNRDILLSGLMTTLLASIIALVGSLIIGTFMAILQVSPLSIPKKLATAYVEFFRNIPLLIIVMFFFVVAPIYGIQFDGFSAGTLGLTLYTSAFVADTVRAGIDGISKGQMEAGRATGLSYIETMWYIILPQAFKIVVAPLGNQFINLVKNSSILAMVTGVDLMYQGDIIASTTFATIETYTMIGLIYLCITLPISYLMKYIEERYSLTN
ncbi:MULTISPECIES: amino acid ABC transporter permease [Enterococcus]|uniref:Glutamine ABC transporter permease n=1 Tax=Enterococcus alcedinis TaxID=1274384 RepID=A0A917N3R5_9ENTE|nr:amino acid ABC transporter permease [Enterococcus alcedinis]MBP2100900.1 putative glutamine transport system permease protein [Enterococcus alcedinis]GGI64803.1 glutamine ABC transporter permease [Enterococcus alcedinis]